MQSQSNQPARTPPKEDALTILQQKGTIEQIAKALPRHFSAERMLRIAMTELRKTPKLRECDPFSFMGCIMQCAQLGLEPGSGLGHAYLVPFGKECTLIPGYKGLADLARRSGEIKTIYADLVMPDDKFSYGVKAGTPSLDWSPASGERDASKMTHAFATAVFRNGDTQFSVLSKAEVDKIRDGLRYTSATWKDHYGEMAKKTAIRRLAKLLPQSPELIHLQALDDAANDGAQFRMTLQPLVDAGVVDQNYDPDPAPADKYDSPAEKAKMDDARKQAIQEFTDLHTKAKAKGANMKQLLGAEAAAIVTSTTEEINTCADVLSGWLEQAK